MRISCGREIAVYEISLWTLSCKVRGLGRDRYHGRESDKFDDKKSAHGEEGSRFSAEGVVEDLGYRLANWRCENLIWVTLEWISLARYLALLKAMRHTMQKHKTMLNMKPAT